MIKSVFCRLDFSLNSYDRQAIYRTTFMKYPKKKKNLQEKLRVTVVISNKTVTRES